jgi:hypothetical protein
MHPTMTNTTIPAATADHPIAKWYTGKARQIILTFVLPTLAEAEALGYWPPNTSRKVAAALNKQTVAARFGKSQERYTGGGHSDRSPDLLSNIGAPDAHHAETGWQLVHAMQFGQVGYAPKALALVEKLRPYATTPAAVAALETAAQWARDFAPIGELLAILDATRPRPTIVLGSLSPTVAGNVGKLMGIDFATIVYPKIEWSYKWMEVMVKGKPVRARVSVATIIWPDGTRHDVSRYAHGSKSGNDQCHACGHAIFDGFNWCPLVATTADGPVSLWVGRDCARKLFAVDVKGDALYDRTAVSAPV